MPNITRETLSQLQSQDLMFAAKGNYDAMSKQGQRIIGMGKSTALDMLDTGTSIAGSLIGGAIGSVVPGAGTAVGAIAGGAIGAGIGEAIENRISGTGSGRDVAGAALTSAVFDVGTFGAGKLFRAGRGLFGKGADEISQEFRKLVASPAPDISTPEGARIALAQSQQMATDRGATLGPTVTESAGWLRRVVDQVGRSSIFTKPIAEKQDKALQEAVVSSFNDLVRGAEKYETFEDIGNHFVSAITAGQEASQAIYGRGLDAIQNRIATTDFKANPIIDSVQNFLKKNETSATKSVKENLNVITATGTPITRDKVVSAGISELSPDVLRKATSILSELKNVEFKGNGVIQYQKQIRNMISDAYDENKPNIARQLLGLEEAVKDGIVRSMKASGREDIAKAYKSLNEEYHTLQEALFPKFNETMIKKGMKTGDFTSIGKVLASASGSDSGKVREFMKSFRKGVETVYRNEKDLAIQEIKDTVKDPKEAANQIRQKTAELARAEKDRVQSALRSARAGFIYHESNKLDSSKILSKQFVDSILKPENTKKMKLIFGDEWQPVQRAMNFAKTALQPGGKLGGLSLVLNGLQFQAVQGIAAGGMLFGSTEGTPAPNWLEAAAILVAPSVFYKIATKPQAINRLIALDNKLARKPPQSFKAEEIVSAVSKIMYSLDKNDIIESRAVAAEMGLPIYF